MATAKLKCTEVADEECRPTTEGILHTQERKLDEWDALLERGYLLADHEGDGLDVKVHQ